MCKLLRAPGATPGSKAVSSPVTSAHPSESVSHVTSALPASGPSFRCCLNEVFGGSCNAASAAADVPWVFGWEAGAVRDGKLPAVPAAVEDSPDGWDAETATSTCQVISMCHLFAVIDVEGAAKHKAQRQGWGMKLAACCGMTVYTSACLSTIHYFRDIPGTTSNDLAYVCKGICI